VKQKLDSHYCGNILTSFKHSSSLVILRVFEDPGVDFFDLRNKDLVVIEEYDGKRTVPLYLNFNDKVFNLINQGVGRPLDRFYHPWEGPTDLHHGRITIHCLHILNNITPRSAAGVQYAATYWTQHLWKAEITEEILEELRCIRLVPTVPERKTTVTDANLVIKWLKVWLFLTFIPYLCTDRNPCANRKWTQRRQRPHC
jgi:hypothetical protein